MDPVGETGFPTTLWMDLVWEGAAGVRAGAGWSVRALCEAGPDAVYRFRSSFVASAPDGELGPSRADRHPHGPDCTKTKVRGRPAACPARVTVRDPQSETSPGCQRVLCSARRGNPKAWSHDPLVRGRLFERGPVFRLPWCYPVRAAGRPGSSTGAIRPTGARVVNLQLLRLGAPGWKRFCREISGPCLCQIGHFVARTGAAGHRRSFKQARWPRISHRPRLFSS